jgi:hypothetical protein
VETGQADEASRLVFFQAELLEDFDRFLQTISRIHVSQPHGVFPGDSLDGSPSTRIGIVTPVITAITDEADKTDLVSRYSCSDEPYKSVVTILVTVFGAGFQPHDME